MTKRTKGKRDIVRLAVGLLLPVFIAFYAGCTSSPKVKTTAMQDSIAVVTFQTPAGGWGYTINVGSRPFIYQDIIPAMQGRIPFHNEEDAQKVGDYVADKLRKKQLPTVTTQELAQLGIK